MVGCFQLHVESTHLSDIEEFMGMPERFSKLRAVLCSCLCEPTEGKINRKEYR